jgi:hypothetical protein
VGPRGHPPILQYLRTYGDLSNCNPTEVLNRVTTCQHRNRPCGNLSLWRGRGASTADELRGASLETTELETAELETAELETPQMPDPATPSL